MQCRIIFCAALIAVEKVAEIRPDEPSHATATAPRDYPLHWLWAVNRRGKKEIAIAECLPIIDHDSFNVMMDFIIVG